MQAQLQVLPSQEHFFGSISVCVAETDSATTLANNIFFLITPSCTRTLIAGVAALFLATATAHANHQAYYQCGKDLIFVNMARDLPTMQKVRAVLA